MDAREPTQLHAATWVAEIAMSPVPPKARPPFLTVNEVAREADVGAHVVRFYARSGLIRAERRAANGYRQFSLLEVKRVRFVRAAQSLGFKLAEIREIMRRSRQHTTPCPLVREIIVRRLRENREHLDSVRSLQERIEDASERWRHLPDGNPDGKAICALIESVIDDTPSSLTAAQPVARSHLRRRA